ncbi:hypothetical protein FA95DRAFT_1574101 [Auriscalpium vulgare]|uniref:Uncharacterized protein n=1 Tax=Auriscalpium vulgare TaxID=40419 RepID=A0ACB8RM26_9AGAM|nr:hypothetical protein FA95DRAFT_1574101 [Auriscalpium vulgare]
MSQAQVTAPSTLPTPSPLDGFGFTTIGRLSALQQRITEGENADYRSPSPAPSEPPLSSPSSSPIHGRPRLLQVLGDSAMDVDLDSGDDVASASHPKDSAAGLSLESYQPHQDSASDRVPVSPIHGPSAITLSSNPPLSPERSTSLNSNPSATHLNTNSQFPLPTFETSPIRPDLIPSLSTLLSLIGTRGEGLPEIRSGFDSKASELSKSSASATSAVQVACDYMLPLRTAAEEMLTRADTLSAEAASMREQAQALKTTADNLEAALTRSRAEVGTVGEKAGLITRFMGDINDWLHARQMREQEPTDRIQSALTQYEEQQQRLAEEARQAEEERQAAAVAQRQEEERLAAEARAAEERQRAEQERQRAEEERQRAEQERQRAVEAAERKIVEEEAERARHAEVEAEKQRLAVAEEQERQRVYEAKRAAVLASKFKNGSESLTPPTSSAGPTIRPTVSHLPPAPAPLRISPANSVPPSSRSASASHSPVSISPHASLPSRPDFPATSRKQKNAAPGFVPAQTEAGRAVRIDAPFTSTTLASERAERTTAGTGADRKPVKSEVGIPQAQSKQQNAASSKTQATVHVKREPSVKQEPSAESPSLRSTSLPVERSPAPPVSSQRVPSESRSGPGIAEQHPWNWDRPRQAGDPQPGPPSVAADVGSRNFPAGSSTGVRARSPLRQGDAYSSQNAWGDSHARGDPHAWGDHSTGTGPVGDGGWVGLPAPVAVPRRQASDDSPTDLASNSRGRQAARYSPPREPYQTRRYEPRRGHHWSPSLSPVRVYPLPRGYSPVRVYPTPRGYSPEARVPSKRTLLHASHSQRQQEPPPSRRRLAYERDESPGAYPSAGGWDRPRSWTPDSNGSQGERRRYPSPSPPLPPSPPPRSIRQTYDQHASTNYPLQHREQPVAMRDAYYSHRAEGSLTRPADTPSPSYEDRVPRRREATPPYVSPQYHAPSAPAPITEDPLRTQAPPVPEPSRMETHVPLPSQSTSLLDRMTDDNKRSKPQPSSSRTKATRGTAPARGRTQRSRTDSNHNRQGLNLLDRMNNAGDSTSRSLQDRLS